MAFEQAITGTTMKRDLCRQTLVVIPAHNEAAHVGQVIEDIKRLAENVDILVVDDASTDPTARLAKARGATVVSLSTQMGYGVALQTGYRYAFEKGYECLVQLDGDGQHDPSYIQSMLDVLTTGEADLVLGSRFLEKGLPKYKDGGEHSPSITRKLGMRLFALLTSLLVGFKITDPTSGYQALNRRVITFFIQDFFPCDYPDADVIVVAHRAGFKIKELPMIIYANKDGKTMHSGLRPLYYTFKMCLSLFMTLLRRTPVL